MVGNKTLERYYDLYNRKYFEGSLPACKTVFCDLWKKHKVRAVGHYVPTHWEKKSPDDGKWRVYRTEHLIEVDHKVKNMGIFWQSTLIHEMAHLAVGLRHKRVKSHGRIWQKEMLRLATIGAFKNLW